MLAAPARPRFSVNSGKPRVASSEQKQALRRFVLSLKCLLLHPCSLATVKSLFLSGVHAEFFYFLPVITGIFWCTNEPQLGGSDTLGTQRQVDLYKF